MNLSEVAARNLRNLAEHPYPGRGIVIGRTSEGDAVQVYWIMGKREDERNRILRRAEPGAVYTDFADKTKAAGDPKLTIYRAMMSGSGLHVVSNGAQTEHVYSGMTSRGNSLLESLEEFTHEPDAPHFTSRITGVYDLDEEVRPYQFAILRKSPYGEKAEQLLYRYPAIRAGFGYCITTYSLNWYADDFLPPFEGEPVLVPVREDADSTAQFFWDHLNEDNRVALAVKQIPAHNDHHSNLDIKVINKYGKSD